MSLLSDTERLAAAADVCELIVASGQAATLLRAEAGTQLYGSDDALFAEVSAFKLEFVLTTREDVVNKIDATACVLPELDIRCEDRILVGNEYYRVQSVVDESLFGVVTHKTLKLVRMHGD